MNMQEIATINSFNRFNNLTNISSGLALTPDFQKILSAITQKSEESKKTDTFVSAEQSLKEIYPGLKYHVLDAS